MNRSSSKRGQILVVVAASLVVLLAIGALVVDLGFSWMLRRHEQNAADPAAIAGARWLKDSTGNPRSPFPEAYTDACFYAQQNGFFTSDTPDCSAARLAGDLQVLWPPTSGPYEGRTDAIQVVISATHPGFFSRIFSAGDPVVTTGAVAVNSAGNSNSSSLVALQPVCSGGSAGSITGGGTVKIFPITPGTPGGTVHVNSPCGSSTDDICQNGSGQSALDISGGGTLITPYAYVQGSCVFNGTSGTNPNPPGFYCDGTFTTSACLDEGALPLADPLAGIPEPRLSDFPNGTCPDGTPSTPSSTQGCTLKRGAAFCPDDGSGVGVCHLTPGVYYGGWDVKSNVDVQLDPGMYILAGGGIKLAADSSIEAVSNVSGLEPRITVFSTDGPGCPSVNAQCQGAVKFTAMQSFKAKATNTASCQAILAAGGPNTCPWRGILLWQDGTASNPTAPVELGGQASSILAGTIYAPLANVKVDGGTSTTGCTTGLNAGCLAIQIISYTWQINGGALVEMPYDPGELYQLDQRGLVH